MIKAKEVKAKLYKNIKLNYSNSCFLCNQYLCQCKSNIRQTTLTNIE